VDVDPTATAAPPVSRSHPKDWTPTEEGHPKRWAILGVLLVSLLVVVLDNTVLNIALPTIQKDLNASQGGLVWAVDAYILVFAALLFSWGVLGDMYGRRRVLLIGLAVFGGASAICAFSLNIAMLIVFRAVMGVGGAAIMAVSLAIITVVFPRHERGRAIGLWAGAVGGAVALGPVLGGLLLQHPQWSSWLTGNDWGSVFLINVPIVLLGLVGVARLVPETRNPHPQALDVPGLLISFVGLVSLVYGIIRASEVLSWTSPSVLIPIIAGVLILTLFLFLEARSDHRSFDVSLFRNRGYAVSLTAVSLAFFAMSGITFSLPFYFQVLRGYDTLQAGLFFLPFAVGQLTSAPRSAGLVARFGYRPVMTTGLLVVAAAQAFMVRLSLDTPTWQLIVLFFFFGLGMGAVIAPASTVMQNVLPLARVGAGSAVQNTVRQVFGAFGVAIVGTLLATKYASNVTGALAPLPPAGQEAAKQSVVATQEVLGLAVHAGLPAPQAVAMRNASFDAFLSASHVTTALSAVIVLLAAVVVGFLLPKITPPQQHAHGTAEAAEPAVAVEA
jgi:DHA2 family multidrug resistance protein-like MFS transporter